MLRPPDSDGPDLLTIAIPTYNRASALARTLAIISPQLDGATRIVILDNASSDATAQVCEDYRLKGAAIDVIRHRFNIGADANIARCCEVAAEGHVWILPDDDLPRDDALANIRATISRHPEADYINFHTSLLDHYGVVRRSARVASSPERFLDDLDCFGNLLFLTAGVYRAGFLSARVQIAHQSIHTCGPSIAVVLQAIGRGEATVVFSPTSIAAWGAFPTWDVVNVTRSVYHLLDLFPDGRLRRRFAVKLFEAFPPRLRRKSNLRGLIDDLDRGDAALAAALERYGIAADQCGRYRLPLLVAQVLNSAAPFGLRALVGHLLRLRTRIQADASSPEP